MSRKYKNIRYKDTGGSNIDLSGIVEHMIPTIDSDGIIGQDLGSPNKKWRDLYLSKGSLYIDGQKVIESNNGTITVQADANQSLLTQTSGTGSLQLSSDNGIQLMGEVNAGTGDLNIGTNIDMNTSLVRELGSPLLGTDAANKNYVDSQVVAALDAGNNVSAADLTVSGNLTVSGTTTTVNSETISLADNIIDLNSNFTSGSPTENAGLKVKRGDDADVQIRWNEASDQWEYTNDGAAYSAIGSGSVDLSGYDTSAEVDAKVAAVDFSNYDTSTEVDAKVAAASSGSSSSSDHDFVASGTLPNGAPVVLKADGTIEAVGEVPTTIAAAIPLGSIVDSTTTSSSNTNAGLAGDPSTDNLFAQVYMGSNYPEIHLRTGTTDASGAITWGDSVLLGSGGGEHNIAFNPNVPGQFLVTWYDQNDNYYPKVSVCQITGSTVSIESTTTVANTNQMTQIKFDPNTPGEFVLMYSDNPNGYVIPCNISGTTVTIGTPFIFDSDTSGALIAFDPHTAGRMAICWVADNGKPRVVIVNRSGLSMSVGAFIEYNAHLIHASAIEFDPQVADRFVIAGKGWHTSGGNSMYSYAVLCSVSGTTITVDNKVTVTDGNSGDIFNIVFSEDASNINTFSMMYYANTDGTGGKVRYRKCTITNNAIVMDAETTIGSITTVTSMWAVPLTTTQIALVYYESTYKAIVLEFGGAGSPGSNLDADNFIGVSTSAYVDGETATITLDGGISTNQVGLTVGEIYHVLDDGTLSTTSTATSTEVGKALSSTDLQIDTKRAVDLSGYDTSAEVDAKVAAVDFSNYDTSTEVDAKVAALVDSAPGALDTLNELAAALGDDADYAASVATTMATKATTGYVDTAVAAVDFSNYDTSAEVDAKVANASGSSGSYSDSDVLTYLSGGWDFHLLPDTNATYDIGSAEKKVRHLFLSDNSLYIGANTLRTAGNSLLFDGEDVQNYANIKNKPTTLAGYGITDEVDAKVANASGGYSETFTAPDTMTVGMPVQYTSEGGIELIESTPIPNSIGTNTFAELPDQWVGNYGTGYEYLIGTAVDPNNPNRFAIVYEASSNMSGSNNESKIVIGNVDSSNNITYGTPTTYSPHDQSAASIRPQVSWCGTSDRIAIRTCSITSVNSLIICEVSGVDTVTSNSTMNLGSGWQFGDMAFVPGLPNHILLTRRDATEFELIELTSNTTFVTKATASNRASSSGNAVECWFDFFPNDGLKFIAVAGVVNAQAITYVGEISATGDSISLGASTNFGAETMGGYVRLTNIKFKSGTSDTFVVCTQGTTDHAKVDMSVGQISGTTVTMSAPVTYQANGDYQTDMQNDRIFFNPNDTNEVIVIENGYYHTLSIEGNVPVVIETVDPAPNGWKWGLQLGSGKFIFISWKWWSGGSYQPVSLTVNTWGGPGASNLDSTAILGIVTNAASVGENVTVVTNGLASGLTGLTAGEIYHVKGDGTLSTTSTATSVRIGKALSSTDLQIDNNYAVDLSGYDTSAEVDAKVAALVDSAPGALDTLNELAAALGDDANYAASVATTMATKATTSYVDNAVAAVDLSGYDTSAEVDAKVANASSGSSSSLDHDFVASGTLPNGIAVMLKSDGTVEAVAETTTSFTGAGSEFVYRSTDGVSETAWYSEGDYQAIEFDPNNPNNFILAYTKVSSQGYLYVVAGTVSGTDITFGSEEVVYNGQSGHISIAFNPYSAGQFVIAWGAASHAGYSRGGKVTGSSITLGTTTATIRSQPCKFNVVIFNPYTNNGNGEHFVITSSGYGKIYKCTMDGAHNVTVGQHGNIPVNTSWYHCGIHHVSAAFDPNVTDRIVIAYTTDGGGYGNPKVIVGMTNTSAPSFNQNMVEYNNANAKYSSMAFFPDNDDKFVVCFSDDGNSNHGSWIIGETLSNNQVGVGSTKSVFNAGAVTDIKFEFEGDGSDKCFVNYVNASGEAVMRQGTYSGTTITFGDEVVISTNVSRTAVAHDPNTSGQMVVAFADGGNNDYGTAVVVGVDQQISSTTMDADKFIGMSTSTYADGETATITLKGGISTNQVGLTPGETYHVLDDGSLSTTSTATSAEVGMALSPTAILLKHL